MNQAEEKMIALLLFALASSSSRAACKLEAGSGPPLAEPIASSVHNAPQQKLLPGWIETVIVTLA